jgi:Leucine-rich repeat (LRR) protein
MKNLFFIFTACMLFLNAASAQNITIPDANFKNVLVSGYCVDTNGDGNGDADADTNNDGEISVVEALAVTWLNVENQSIVSLEGVQYFTNLLNLGCANNQLTTLNVQGLTNLQNLGCYGNQLTILNVQGLINLERLGCDNNQLTTLNVQGLTNLQILNCANNQLTTLNVQGLTNLQNLGCYGNQLTTLNVQGCTNLQILDCYNSQLTTLNVQGCTNLQRLDCYGNQLTTLNVQGLTNLRWLYCYSNQLMTLNAQDLTNLQKLDCYRNPLTTLNVQGCTNLQILNCANNQLTTLNVQGCTNLQELNCDSGQLPSLNVQNCINLQTLHCPANRLTSLNVQGCTNLQYLNCCYNQLTSLFIKNGRNESLFFSNNPNLAYICCDESELPNIQGALPNCTVNSYCSFTPGGVFYTIQGVAKFDANINGCTASDRGFPNLKYNLFNNTANIVGVYVPDTSGSYNLPLHAGIYNLRPVFENPTYFNITPTNTLFSFPNTTSDTLTQNFCVTPNGVHHDVEATIIPVTPARPGFDAKYQIVYKNKGTAVESDSISFKFEDEFMDFVTADIAPSSQRTDFLVWQYSNLQPFETRSITVTMNMNSPMETPPVNAGDIVKFQATVYPLLTDEMPSDNRPSLRQTVVGSIDPNDKTCLEGGKITPDMVGDYLHYVIRFENTGTYAAENIVVKDMIDISKFDIASLQMTKASHDCRTRILNGNQVEFIFENINLPFTAPNKYGYVAFKIKTKPTIALGDAVTNKADIFFDYNFPITTNTATTQVVTSLTPSEGGKPNSIVFDIAPNPVTDILTLKTDITIEKCEIYDNLGRVVQSSGVQNQQISVAHLPKGSYFIKVFGGNGSAVQRFVKL